MRALQFHELVWQLGHEPRYLSPEEGQGSFFEHAFFTNGHYENLQVLISAHLEARVGALSHSWSQLSTPVLTMGNDLRPLIEIVQAACAMSPYGEYGEFMCYCGLQPNTDNVCTDRFDMSMILQAWSIKPGLSPCCN